MDAIAVAVVFGVLVAIVYCMVLSREAKKDLELCVHVGRSGRLSDLAQAVLDGLPPSWVEVGEKTGYALVREEGAATAGGGNFLSIATGVPSVSCYVISVQLECEQVDEHGRMVSVPFDEAPPRDRYDARIWVSYASQGIGRTWGPVISKRILSAKSAIARELEARPPTTVEQPGSTHSSTEQIRGSVPSR